VGWKGKSRVRRQQGKKERKGADQSLRLLLLWAGGAGSVTTVGSRKNVRLERGTSQEGGKKREKEECTPSSTSASVTKTKLKESCLLGLAASRLRSRGVTNVAEARKQGRRGRKEQKKARSRPPGQKRCHWGSNPGRLELQMIRTSSTNHYTMSPLDGGLAK
jgi:hypothetical protein